MKKLPLLLASVSLLALPSCSAIGVAAGAGASLGIAAAQEGGISQAASDARIQLEINELWFSYSIEAFRKLDLTVDQGRVLVTGVVQDPEQRVEAIRLAWQPVGVEQVINEVQVAEGQGIGGFARDTWITTRLRTGLTFDSEILSINYSIDTVQGTVYLMGFAQSREELNRVIERARAISGVQGVVSYVKIVSGVQESVNEAPAAWGDDAYNQPAANQAAPVQLQPLEVSPPTPVQGQNAVGQPVAISPEFSSPAPVVTQVEATTPYIVRDQTPVTAPVTSAPQVIEREEIFWNE